MGILLVIALCFLTPSCGCVIGYRRVTPQEFNELRLASLQPPHLHKIPWDGGNSYCELFVSNKEIEVYLSIAEWEQADDLLTPKETARLNVIRDAFRQGWEAGTMRSEFLEQSARLVDSHLEGLNGEIPEELSHLPACYKKLWTACKQHGYLNALRMRR